MRIVQEKVESENFIEISLSPKDFAFLKDYMIMSKKTFIENEPYNLSVKLGIYEDFDDGKDEEYF